MIVTTWMEFGTGLGQPRRASNGFRKGMERINALRIPGLVCELNKWDSRKKTPEGVARRIVEQSRAAGVVPRIIAAGHSFGGYWANQFAIALGRFGFYTFAMVLADAVGHRPDRGIAVSHWVQNLWTWRQKGPLISGSKIMINASYTKYRVDYLVDSGHAGVDETPELQQLLLDLAQGRIAA